MRCEAELIEQGHKDFKGLMKKVEQGPSVSDYTSVQPPGAMRKDERVVHGDRLHFAAIQLHVVEMDIVLLRREGHLRSKLTLSNGEWVETSLIP